MVSCIENELKESNIFIYGAGVIARAVIKTLREEYEDIDERLISCIVTDLNFNVRELEGVAVHDIDEIRKIYTKELILICVRERYIKDIEETLDSYNMDNYYVFDINDCITILQKKLCTNAPERYFLFQNNIDRLALSDEEYVMFLCKQLKSKALDFEVNLADHCNLNCQCCNHFSPIATTHFLDVEKYEKDIARLSELIKGKVGTLMLLGGEPLLHPKINEIMCATRVFFPEADIVIVSNGILLPQMNQMFWDICKKNNVGIQLTKYPIRFNYYECKRIAEDNGVKLTFTHDSEKEKTTYRLPIKEEGDLNPYKNYVKCYHANKCVVLREGCLYTCPISANIHLLNNFFNKNLPEGEVNSINIYDVNSYEEIDEFLKRPIPMCHYCDIYNYEYNIPWKISKKEISEWM